MTKVLLASITVASVLFTGCAKYEPSPNMTELKASFADKKWDGKRVPKDEVCSDYNKKGGHTPSLIINNLPKDVNKIILSFSDNNPKAKMMNGGHGILSYKVEKSSTSITIPSIKGETFDLPTNFESIKAHAGTQWGKKPGAYLPPCSGGRGNPYSVKVEAIQEFADENQTPILHGETNISLGRY